MTAEAQCFKAFIEAHPEQAKTLQDIGQALYAAAERLNLPRDAGTVKFITDILCLDACGDRAIAARYRNAIDPPCHSTADAEERLLLEKIFVKVEEVLDRYKAKTGLTALFAVKKAQGAARGYSEKNKQALLDLIATDHLESLAAIVKAATDIAMCDPACASDGEYRQLMLECDLPEESQPPAQRYNSLVGTMTSLAAAKIGEIISLHHQSQSHDASAVAQQFPQCHL